MGKSGLFCLARGERTNRFGGIKAFAILPVFAALLLMGCGLDGSTPTGPKTPPPVPVESIADLTKAQNKIVTLDILVRMLPAMNGRGHALSMEAEIEELDRKIQDGSRARALASIPVIRARIANWKATEPANSNDQINIEVVLLYLDWIERTIQ